MHASDAACAASAAGRRVAAWAARSAGGGPARGVVIVPAPSRGGLGAETNRILHATALSLALDRSLCLNVSASPSYRFLAPLLPLAPARDCGVGAAFARIDADFTPPADVGTPVLFDHLVANPSSNVGVTSAIAALVGDDYAAVVACLSVAWLRPGGDVLNAARPYLYALRRATASVGVHVRTSDAAMIRLQCYYSSSRGCGRERRLALHLGSGTRPGCASDAALLVTLQAAVLPSCLSRLAAEDVVVFVAADHDVAGASPWLGDVAGNLTVLATPGTPQHTGRPSPLASHADAELKAVLDFLILTEATVFLSNCDLRCNFWTHQGKCGNTFAYNVLLRRSAPALALANLFAPLSGPANLTCTARLDGERPPPPRG
jgi:hypothetical protein